nr:MAG TPA: hypothetical protein [Caudoviricetes sp.]
MPLLLVDVCYVIIISVKVFKLNAIDYNNRLANGTVVGYHSLSPT